MNKLLRNMVLLVLLLFVSQVFCYAKNDSVIIRKEVMKVVKELSTWKDNVVVDFSARATRKSLLLTIGATDDELILLTSHKNLRVKVFSFQALALKGYKNIKALMEQHVSDTSVIYIQIGCGIEPAHVNRYFLSLLAPNKYDVKPVHLISEAEANEIRVKMPEVTSPMH